MDSFNLSEMEDDLPDLMDIVNAARSRGAGVSLGDSLKSKRSMTKRKKEGSVAPSVVRGRVKGEKEKEVGAVKVKEVRGKEIEKAETEIGGTRRSARIAIAASNNKELFYKRSFNDSPHKRSYNDLSLSIDWQNLPKRITTHIPYLTKILENKCSSIYRDAAAKALISSTKGKRNLMDTDWQSHTPGYYGPRGAYIMLMVLMGKMADRIREVGGESNDKVIAQGGVCTFVQSVLVPEVGVRLVMEDLGCSEERAREVVQETIELGELVNYVDEKEDYVFEDDEDKDGGVWVSV